jgi:hypothetical protein
MFPDENDPKPWDEYGEVIDPEEFRQKEDDPMDLGRNLVSSGCAQGECKREWRLVNMRRLLGLNKQSGQFLMTKFCIEVCFSLGPDVVSSVLSQVTVMIGSVFMSVKLRSLLLHEAV